MAYILHIDTSADKGVTAISKNGKVLAEKINEEARNNASTINTDIDYILKVVGVKLKDIAAVAVCAGPGSYTGLRIGTSTAKGICYALDKPLMMHNKLTLLSHHVMLTNDGFDYILAVLPAREKEYYITLYDKHFAAITLPKHIFEDELLELIDNYNNIAQIGSINNTIQTAIKDLSHSFLENIEVNINSWAAYADEQYDSNSFVNLANSEPDYLKKVYTHKPKTSK